MNKSKSLQEGQTKSEVKNPKGSKQAPPPPPRDRIIKEGKAPEKNNIITYPAKNSWSTQEVKELVYSVMKSKGYTSIQEFNDWIENNLTKY